VTSEKAYFYILYIAPSHWLKKGADATELTNQVVEMKRGIGAGCKLKMDDGGNILVKR
jgi:hypothetical protein